MPFAAAATTLTLMTGAHISPATIRRGTIASGQAVRQLELACIQAVATGTAPASPVPTTPLQLSVDGSMVPLVHGAWQEVRMATVGVLTPDPARSSTAQFGAPSHVAALCSAETFADEALGEVVRRGVDQAATVVAISDGAAWNQGFVDLH